MKNTFKFILLLITTVFHTGLHASLCPDPITTSLRKGVVPAPWVVNPFSQVAPQGDATAYFTRANILVAEYGHGVMCTYHIPSGNYSIWWPVWAKLPSYDNPQWITVLGGFVCTGALADCVFYVANYSKYDVSR